MKTIRVTYRKNAMHYYESDLVSESEFNTIKAKFQILNAFVVDWLGRNIEQIA